MCQDGHTFHVNHRVAEAHIPGCELTRASAIAAYRWVGNGRQGKDLGQREEAAHTSTHPTETKGGACDCGSILWLAGSS
jgi:hypothetical protein